MGIAGALRRVETSVSPCARKRAAQFPPRPSKEQGNEEAAFAASVLPGELENLRYLADGDVPRDSSADPNRLRHAGCYFHIPHSQERRTFHAHHHDQR